MTARVALGFDTSCYTTSAAAVNDRGEVLASSRMLLPVPTGQRGLRQSEAVFAHVRQMPAVMDNLAPALKEARIVAVCASSAPRPEADSYMPVFGVGYGHARVLAAAMGAAFFETTHQQGHIAAGLVDGGPMPSRFVALHVSGGTTDVLLSDGERLSPLGGSADLHAGQLVDRVGVALGLGFPAGPQLEPLALQANARALLPASLEADGLTCHLSGAETQAQRLIQAGSLSREQIAAEVYDLLARTLSRLLDAACRREGVDVALVVGGVASSQLLRRLMDQRLRRLRAPFRVRYGQPQYSADNAVGVASIGMRAYLASQPTS